MALEISEALRAGRRAIEGLPGARMIGDWNWNKTEARFMLHIELEHAGRTDAIVPRRTEWFVAVQATYPSGSIKLYPSAENGIVATFQHQSYNGKDPGGNLWRDGDICVRSTVQILGRSGLDREQVDPEGRLRWTVERALSWLTSAADGTLALPGEPFELPAFPSTAGKTPYIAFSETTESFANWQKATGDSGSAIFRQLMFDSAETFVAERFVSRTGDEIIASAWGDLVRAGKPVRGIWIRLPSPPVVPPWEVPSDWTRLLGLCRAAKLDLPAILSEHDAPGSVDRAVLLVGFPIPRNIGESSKSYHWQGIKLPQLRALPPGKTRRRVPHFRRLDPQRELSGSIEWLPSHNWAPAELGSRGMLPDWIRSRHVFVLGAGAVGSIISELLVRGGVHRLTLMDDETIEAGNLARHALTLRDLKANKAERMAEKLRSVSPHARITAMAKNMKSPQWTDVLAEISDPILVLDCSGDNNAAEELGRVTFDTSTRFASVSFSLNATPLYVFTAEGPKFPVGAMLNALAPHLAITAARTREETLPREGIGCWHPVFPARADEVHTAVSVALRLVATDFGPHGLRVIDLAELNGKA